MKKLGTLLLVFFASLYAMQVYGMVRKVHVIVNPNALVKQNIDDTTMQVDGARVFSKQEVLADQLHYRTMTNACLWAMSMASFGCLVYSQRSAKLGFFKFLQQVPFSRQEECPPACFEGDQMPPIMVAWVLGWFSSAEVIGIINNFITDQKYCGEVDRFLRAIVYTTFDPEVMEKTCYLDPATVAVVREFRDCGHAVSLAGHCNPASHEQFKRRAAQLLDNFNRVVFSYQMPVTQTTQFGPQWWAERVHGNDAQSSECALGPWAYIDDTGSDSPPAYASNSPKLKRLIQRSAT